MNRRLYRSRTDTILAGVAAGLARYVGTDPALVRIAWAILVPLTGGAAFFAYIVAWVVVPEEPTPVSALTAPPTAEVSDPDPDADRRTTEWAAAPPEPEARRNGTDAGLIVGAGLVLVGLWFLLREYLPDVDWGFVWPLAVVAIGALIVASSMRRRER